jgi:hypothetical protein
MNFALQLLSVARKLAIEPSEEAFQASLRRSLSTTYYALFHLLVEEAVATLVLSAPQGLRSRASRAFFHNEINKVCGQFSKQLTPELKALLPAGVPDDLRIVAETFSELQQVRHRADYDPDFVTMRSFALVRINEAARAFSAWQRIRGSDEATVFLAALAFGARWSK